MLPFSECHGGAMEHLVSHSNSEGVSGTPVLGDVLLLTLAQAHGAGVCGKRQSFCCPQCARADFNVANCLNL